LLSVLAGILTPVAGEVSVFGARVDELQGDAMATYRRSTVGIVFQAFNLIPSLTALENVAAPMLIAGVGSQKARQRASELLARVDLTDRADHRPGDLSGGQQQRVAIARALVHDPPLLLADEPTAHLDYIQVEKVLQIIRDLAGPERVVVVSTHDPRIIPIADRVVDLAPSLATARRPPEGALLAAGDVLFEQGSRGDLIYVVELGEIEIVRVFEDGREEVLSVLRPGQHFGELGPLLGIPRTATARARMDAAVTGFTVRDFRDRATDDPQLAKLFARLGDDE
jgi:putative ABC transport system ATP-binding protein